MINRNSNRVAVQSFIPKFSDADILRVVIHSDFWRTLFLRQKEAIWMFAKAIFNIKLEMFISPIRMVLHGSHGRRTTGVFIVVMSCLMMIGFNAKTPWGIAANLFPFAAPILPFFMTPAQLTDSTFGEIRSANMMYFWMGYLVISSIHLLVIYKQKVDVIPPTKRGVSWLYLFVFKHIYIPENFVILIIEPILVVAIGYGLHAYSIDSVMGLFLIISGLCLFIQEFYDTIMRVTTKE